MDQPAWKELTTHKDALIFAEKVGFPVLVRPSFVLSGAAMSVATNEEELVSCLQSAEDVSERYKCFRYGYDITLVKSDSSNLICTMFAHSI